jgi:myo-inositol-1(or 4)-monophosphatase
VDKKLLLSPNLARIMVDYLPEINELVSLMPFSPSTNKSDGSPVTALDLALSELTEKMAAKYYPEVVFYSEEKFSKWGFPLLAIDPLDGTREYLARRPEWVLSIGLFDSQDLKGQGWVYNPVTKELFEEESIVVAAAQKSHYVGEVSRTEWENNLYTKMKSDKFMFQAMGSIAYKLGRLSAGKTDFVISLYPKNIWDIAGGSLLCQKSGIKFYSEGKEVTEVKQKYLPPLIWCREEIFSELSSIL